MPNTFFKTKLAYTPCKNKLKKKKKICVGKFAKRLFLEAKRP